MTHPLAHRLVAITGVVALLTSASLVLFAQGGGGRGGQAPGQPTGGQRGAAPPPGRGGGLPPRDGAGTITSVGTASISGSVIVEGSGAPVRRARVTLTGAELRGSRSAVTDDQGRFSLTSLPAGRFTLTASKAGFVDNTYGAKRAGRPGTPIQLAEGQALDRRVVSLPRGGVITGVVVDDIGEPAAGTQVRVLRYVIRTGERVLQQSGQAAADDRGVYRIYQLQPGDYIVNALPRNMSTGDLRQSITNEVQALMQQAQTLGAGRGGGQSQPDLAALASLAASGRGTAVLDRIAQLQQQLAQSDQEQPTAYAPVYYPGTTSASGAQTITLGVSEERAGVDFQLQLVPTARVNGIVSGPNGTPQGTQIALVPVDRGGLPGVANFGMNQARVGADGRFSFSDVTPGQYSLQARATIREGATGPGPATVGPGGGGFGGRGGPGGVITQVLWAAGELTVGGQNINDIVLNLQNGLTIGGRVEFQPGATEPPADLTRVRVMLTPRGTQPFDIGSTPPTPPGQTDAAGRFSIPGVAPGRYTIFANILPAAQGAAAAQAGTPAGGRGGRAGGAPGTASGQWTLKSAVVDGRDILDFPLEIGPSQESQGLVLSFTDKTQELSGTLQDASGRPTADFTIILFPTDSRYWLPQARRIASARPGTDGRFTIRGVPPGQYRLTAVTDVEPGEWYDPAFLGQVQGASIPITLAEGDKKVQDIRLAGGN